MVRSVKAALPYRECVGIMVINNENKVWMGYRPVRINDEFKPDDDNRWQMPQGGINKGEEPLAAAKRELWEETGMTSVTLLGEAPGWIRYDLPKSLIGNALKGKYQGQTQKWFAFRFEGDEKEINISHPPNDAPVEFDRWQWVDMDELVRRIVHFKRKAYIQVVEAFRHFIE